MTVDYEYDGPGKRQLAWLEGEDYHLRLSSAADVAIALEELRQVETLTSRALRLGRWALDLPHATTQLISVIGRDAALSCELAPTLLGCEAANELVPEYIDEALAAAFPRLTSPWRDAAADRPGVRRIVGLSEGEGYDSVPKPHPEWQWPLGKEFPAVDTIKGIQARLNYAGFGCGSINGEWNEMTRRAFVRWQVSKALDPKDLNPTENEYDLDSRRLTDWLQDSAPEAPLTQALELRP